MQSVGSRQKKYFSKYEKRSVNLADFVNPQRDSFKQFLEEGMWNVFQEYNPIRDHNNLRFELSFISYRFGAPQNTESEALENSLTYGAPLKVTVQLKNKTLKVVKKQELSFGDIPLMTSRGSFIVNGIERVIVSQITRSFGVFFGMNVIRNRKCFTAKIIPQKGVWLEFESGTDNIVTVRINRGGKIPITALLRTLGLRTDNMILEAAPEEIRGQLQKILDKDTAKNHESAYISIYEKMRPGSHVSFDNAKKYVDSLIDVDRLDISQLGRSRFNRRMGLPVTENKLEQRYVSAKDVIYIYKEILRLNADPGAQPDDIDHLALRRVRTVGELLQNRMRKGIAKLARNTQDKMTTLDPSVTMPIQFVNSNTFQFEVRDFFMSDQLSHKMEQKNLLDEIEHRRTVTALGPGGLTREHAGIAVRDLHPSHYGRICPVHTPEGQNIGLNLHYSLYARGNRFGIIETPYLIVEDGKITKKLRYLDAEEEEQYKIAHGSTKRDSEGNISISEVVVRYKGEPKLINKKEVDLIDVSGDQILSVAGALIPFAEHNATHRSLLGSTTQRQALACIKPQAPLVATGIEEDLARASNRIVVAEEDGIVDSFDSKHITIKSEEGKKVKYQLEKFIELNDKSVHHQRPIVALGQKVKKGDIIADSIFTDNGQLAIGQNLRVAFLSWRGYNYEDAQVLSKRLLEDDRFTSIHMKHFEVKVLDTKLGPELTTFDIPNVSEPRLRNLDEDGIVRIGAEVSSGDILVGKVTPKGETQLTPEERLLRSIFGDTAKDVKDTSFKLPAGYRGRIVNVKIFDRKNGDNLPAGTNRLIKVTIAQLRKISIGDKLTGRHGNKGVISKILPVENMPFTEDGEPVDIVLSPLGIPSRMNLGQVYETQLGLVAEKLGYQAIAPAFSGASEEEITAEFKKIGLTNTGKQKIYDGNTGEVLGQDVTVGYMYLLKLNHMVEDKSHSRSVGKYSLISQQPLPGKSREGGQRVGEMEVWAFLGYGAAYNIREILTIKSDDIYGRSAAFDAIVKGERITQSNIPASFNVLVNYLRGLGLDISIKRDRDEESKTKS